MVVRHALGASRCLGWSRRSSLNRWCWPSAPRCLGLGVAQAVVRYAWLRASQIIGDGLPFWVDVTLEPVTVAYALLLALVAAALIGLLPALKATRAVPSSTD